MGHQTELIDKLDRAGRKINRAIRAGGSDRQSHPARCADGSGTGDVSVPPLTCVIDSFIFKTSEAEIVFVPVTFIASIPPVPMASCPFGELINV